MAFEALKTALTTTPMLQLPRFDQQFEIHTDASATGVGVVLLQDQHPVAYFSKTLSPRLRAASAYAREMYAITEAVRRWRQYLLGRPFLIYTDHQSLRTMMYQTVQTPEQHRWLVKLLGYEFQIFYKPGSSNQPADALSRIPSESGPHLLSMNITRPLPALWGALHYAYKADTTMQDLFSSIHQNPDDHSNYSIRNNIILFQGRVLVPKNTALQQLLISEYHNTRVGGHAGIRRTFHRIASTFTWPNLKKDVRDFINNCHIC